MSSPAQPLSPQDFAAKVRTKYPGAYDSISDDELTARILAKHPEYQSTVQAAPQSSPNPYQEAAQRVMANPQQASMGDANTRYEDTDAYKRTHPEQSGLHRFMSSAGVPTSQVETSNMVQGILTPDASTDPAHYSPLQNIPVVGPIFRAQREAYDKDHLVGSIPLAGPPMMRASEQAKQGDYAGAAGSSLNALTQLLGLRAIASRTPAVASETLSDVANRTAGYRSPGPTTDVGAKVSATSKLLGREITGRIPILNRFSSTRIPTFEEYLQALRSQADPQLSLYNNTPKLGETPLTPQQQQIVATAESAAKAVPSGSAPSPAAPSGPSTLPRVNSGEGVLNQALTSLDNKTLVKVAKSRGLDITAEAQLKPEMGNPRLIRKLMDSFTGDELDNARDMGIEISRNQPVESNGIPPEAAKEAWRYKVLNTFFPDVAMPKSMLARVGDTLAAQAKARSDAAQFNSIRSQAEGAANAIPMDQPLTGQDLIQALRNMAKTAGK